MRNIDGLSEIADRFDALILDQFGVLHDGTRAYPEAMRCLDHFALGGKKLVVLSNSGRRSNENCERLASLGFRPGLFDAVITSGEVVWLALAERSDRFHRALGRRCYLISESGEAPFLSGLDLEPTTTMEHADFILVLGIDTPRSALEDYFPVLEAGARRGLPMVCANSDMVRITRWGMQPAPGALARRYEQLGGLVQRYGKPLPAIYERCLATMNGVDRRRILTVGDSLEHDIAGAHSAGLDSLYIRDGIGGGKTVSTLASDYGEAGAEPDYVAETFRW